MSGSIRAFTGLWSLGAMCYDLQQHLRYAELMCGRRDKCSIKRSVLGAMCKLGSNVKIINSVLMDIVVVHDGCHLQNCIVCTGAQLQASILKLLPCPRRSCALSVQT